MMQNCPIGCKSELEPVMGKNGVQMNNTINCMGRQEGLLLCRHFMLSSCHLSVMRFVFSKPRFFAAATSAATQNDILAEQ